MSENQIDDWIVPGLPTRQAAKKDSSLICSDHVPQLISIGDIQLLTWNVYKNGEPFGYQEVLEDIKKSQSDEALEAKYNKYQRLKNSEEIPENEKKDVENDRQTLGLGQDLSPDKVVESCFKHYQNLFKELKEKKKEAVLKFNKERSERVINKIEEILKTNSNISVLTFQEMSEELRESLKIKLDNGWGVTHDSCEGGDTATFYRNNIWEQLGNSENLVESNTDCNIPPPQVGHKVYLKNKNTSQNIELNNAHLRAGQDYLDAGAKTISQLLSHSRNDDLTRIVIGDLNNPIKKIVNESGHFIKSLITSLCPPNFNKCWTETTPVEEKQVVHAIDGAFASKNGQLLTCKVESIDLTTGSVVKGEANDTKDFGYEEIPTRYLDDVVSVTLASEQNILVLPSFKNDILGDGLYQYAVQRFETEGHLKAHYFSFSYFFKGYSLNEKVKALYLFQLYLESSNNKADQNNSNLRNFIRLNLNDMPRIMGALENGRLGKEMQKYKKFSCFKKQVTEIATSPQTKQETMKPGG